jgi:signal transduction histidine kinase
MTPRARHQWHYAGAVAWILLTVSMASWWLVFGLQQERRLLAIGAPQANELGRVQRMLVWEGASFIGLLLVGGVGLLVSVAREHARQREVEAFFMAFTHDLKTTLASLQLQAESLLEDLPDAKGNPNLERLLKDALRLQLQLENSLYFAEPEGGLYLEPLDLRAFADRIAADWPELALSISGDAFVMVDSRALESVLRNLLQNAVTHGHARHMTLRIESFNPGRVTITAADDGRGTSADVVDTLGQPFSRPTPMSGTGVGLFVSRRLVERMRGQLGFRAAPNEGFTAILELPQAERPPMPAAYGSAHIH